MPQAHDNNKILGINIQLPTRYFGRQKIIQNIEIKYARQNVIVINDQANDNV